MEEKEATRSRPHGRSEGLRDSSSSLPLASSSDYRVFVERLANDVAGLLLSSPLPQQVAATFAGLSSNNNAPSFTSSSTLASTSTTTASEYTSSGILISSSPQTLRSNTRAFDEQTKNWTFTQEDENDPAQMVLLNEPALANWMGSIHPNGSLYERPLNIRAAQQEHLRFKEVLTKHGCFVMTVKEILLKDVETDIVARVKLEELAYECVKYVIQDNGSVLTENDKYLLSDAYKRQAIDKMNAEQLVELVLTNPTIILQKADKDTELLAVSYSFKPLVNLVFCRDQQITTRKGIVIANLSSPIREREKHVMKFCFKKLGIPILGEVIHPGKLEGGDFFPLGKDFCMIGVGLRSNMDAVHLLMENDWFGTTRVAVVKDYFDQNQQRMHLDTVFNVLKPRCALILETIMGESSPLRRLVDEYTKGKDGKYRLTRHDVEFVKYLTDNQIALIPVSEENQINYGCNGLNLGNGNLLMVDKETAKKLARSPYFNGKITVLDFRNMTDMYGSVHCCSQVISRQRPLGLHGPDSIPMFLKAASLGDINSIKRLIASGVEVTSMDYDKRTALHVAASENHVEAVQYLLTEGAEVNIVDRWGNTPLDDAMRIGGKECVEILRENGGKTAMELRDEKEKELETLRSERRHALRMMLSSSVSQTDLRQVLKDKRSNRSGKAIMVAPSNFDHNPLTESTNLLMKRSVKTKQRLTQKSGRREMRALLLAETERLHRILTVDFGIEVFLFTHEAYENAPEAVYVADWFSTHSALECGEPTMILYPVRAPNRRTERRKCILDLLHSLYPRCINLTHCEQGVLEISNKYDEPIDTTPNPAGKYLEAGALVLDRRSLTAYCALSERANREVAELWKKAMNFELVLFDTHCVDGAHLAHTSHLLFIGSGYAIVALELIVEAHRERVVQQLTADGLHVIEISTVQALHFCTHAFEGQDKGGKPVLLLSKTAKAALSKEQVADLLHFVADIREVDMSTIEALGGGSVEPLINSLF